MRTPRRPLLPTLLIGLAATLCVWLLGWSGATWRTDAWYYDFLLSHSREHADDSIVIVAIDDKSLSALGRWPWPRRTHAHLLDLLDDTQARGIGLDIVFAEAEADDRASDTALAEAIRRHGRIVLPVMAEQSEPDGPPVEALPLPALMAVASGIGHVEVAVEPDGVARRAYLRAGLGDAHWPALALAMRDLDAHGGAIPGLRDPDPAKISPYLWHRDYEVMIPYVSDDRGFQQVSYIDVVRGQVPISLLRDHWLLVGVTANGTGDTVQTPIRVNGGRISGVEYQANLLNMLLRGNAIVPLAPWLQVVLGIVLALLPVLAIHWRSLSKRSWSLVPVVALLALLLSAGLLYFARLWFAPVAALATLLLEFALLAVYRWRKSQQLAHSDALTTMANRRMFDAMLMREMAASERSTRPLSLLLIDVDHFKHYNDTYGHQAGDEVLRKVARAISKHARRPRDLPARYGGDEMAALLPETSSQAACAIADAIVEEVRVLAIPHADSGVAPVVTVSIGIASGDPLRDPRGSHLLERADVALYRAKQNGRDRSYCAPAWDA